MELTILMPCLNEKETVGSCIEEALRFIKENDIDGEVLVADNGSTDGSDYIALKHGARVIKIAERGYGYAIIGGIKAARGKYIITGDSDMSYDFYHLDGFMRKLRKGYALVIGNRLHNAQKGSMIFSHQYIGVPLLSFIGRRRSKTMITDFHCGLRGFEREKALAFNFQCGNFNQTQEQIFKFAKAGERITQTDIIFRKDGRNRKPHLRTVPDGLCCLKYLVLER